MKVLLVEDDQFIVDVYSLKLKEAGFIVQTAFNGQEALRKIKEDLPDILLLDLVLPDIEGWEVLKAIKEDDKLSGLKVVILSNLSSKKEIEKGINLGAIKYLVKAQYTPTQIVEEIKKIIK